MTTIIYHRNKVYADCSFYKGRDRFESITKIQRILDPFSIKCEKEDFAFDDVVYGWSGTGNQQLMGKFVAHLEHQAKTRENSGLSIAFYNMAASEQLVSPSLTFEVILVGKEFNHGFRYDEFGFAYKKYGKDETITLGGGGRHAMRFLQEHGDPIRAMWEVFQIDENSGGMIDVWELGPAMKGNGLVFNRAGMMDSPEKVLLPMLLNSIFKDKTQDIPLSFVRRRDGEIVEASLRASISRLDKQIVSLKKRLAGAKDAAPPARKVAKKVVKKVV